MQKPRLRMIAGPNGSGKSTIIKLLRPEWIGEYVNADDLQKELLRSGEIDFSKFDLNPSVEELRGFLAQSGFLRNRQRPEIQKQDHRIAFDHIDAYLAAALADFVRVALVDLKRPFTFETVMSDESRVQFFCKARDEGFKTYLYFIATESADINISRVRLRVKKGGHPVPEEKIVSRYGRSLNLLLPALQCADRAFVFDNSGELGSEKLLFELKDGIFFFHADQLPSWFQTHVLSKMDI